MPLGAAGPKTFCGTWIRSKERKRLLCESLSLPRLTDLKVTDLGKKESVSWRATTSSDSQ